MEVICSLTGIAGEKWTRRGLSIYRQAGFSDTVLDFNLFNKSIVPKENWEDAIGCWREELHDYIKEAVRQGIKFKIAVLPDYEKEYKAHCMEKLMDGLIRECIKYSGEYGCKYVVVAPIERDSRSEFFAINRDFYLSLEESAKKAGVSILLVNTLKNYNGHYMRGFCSNPTQAASLVDELNNKSGVEIFGFCLDVGICNMVGQNVCDFMVTLGSRLKSLFLYENDGVHYNRIMPFFSANGFGSQFDWFNFIRGLREFSFNGLAVVDFSTTMMALPQPLHPAIMDFVYRLTKYLERQSGTKYLEWQAAIEEKIKEYPSCVLFGAGNMSRAYVEHYGEKYPPLYVCDNNPKLWGTKFCGLIVHNPEDLKSLPTDCAVIVCNVLYHDEIEHQLREMGVKNPIEKFNDEFMPSFQLNRVESHAWKEQVK